jgi:lysophospholipase L1-like esterase
MIEKLIAYGDSFVQGGGLDPNDTMSLHPDSWPFLLAQKLKITDVTNRGVGGGSNKLSIMKLFEDIDDLVDLKNTLIIFVWTGMQRTCIYHEREHHWQNVLVGHRSIVEKYRKVSDLYYEWMYSDHDAYTTLLQQQIFVKLYLEYKKVNYFFANSFISNRHLYKEDQIGLFFKEKYLFGYLQSLHQKACYENKMISQDKFHPNKEGHNYIANEMFSYIKNNIVNGND